MVQHLYTFDDPPSKRDLDQVVHCLTQDGLVSYPTDVNWAFGCDSISVKAMERVRMLKPFHPKEQPFSLICSSISMAAEYAQIGNSAYRLLRKIWPGPYTVILQRNRSLPRQFKDKRKTIGIRIIKSNLLNALIELLGRPLATTSVPKAVLSPHTEPAVIQFGYQVADVFGHGLDIVLDLGQELSGLETTVIEYTADAPMILRKGAGDTSIFEGFEPDF